MFTAGRRLREVRRQRGLKLRDVEHASQTLDVRYSNDQFRISATRLHEIEVGDETPSIYKLYSLAAIYKVPYSELLQWYGIDPERAAQEFPAGIGKAAGR